MEKKLQRPIGMVLASVHLVSYALAVICHATLLRFWWEVLSEKHVNIQLPLWAGVLMIGASTVCCLAFGANIYQGVSGTPRVASKAS
jgi:hypothetical protein